MTQVFDPRLAHYQREEGVLGRLVRYMPCVSSTNDLLLEMGTHGAPEGFLILAESQSEGRGRLGRRWASWPGTSLLMSLLFRPPHASTAERFAFSALRVTMICAVALLEATQDVAGVRTALKWPNDLIVMAQDGGWRKVGGMLSEIGAQGQRLDFIVVGIGLNVNIPASRLASLSPRATSLGVEARQCVDRVALLDRFLVYTDGYYRRFRSGWDPYPVWLSHLAWLGQQVWVQTTNEVFRGIVEGVDRGGALRLRLPDGGMRHFTAGDVTLRRSPAS
jgi:BirA family transcriptional regulator, biotin operon repressor / biotin---[acetyl-CoA-carboxylase] ligase